MTPQAWRLAPGITLRHRRWDDRFVVYFGGPGDTHLVDAVGLAILLALARQAMSMSALVELVCEVSGEPDSEAARFMLADFLGQMNKSGLVDADDW